MNLTLDNIARPIAHTAKIGLEESTQFVKEIVRYLSFVDIELGTDPKEEKGPAVGAYLTYCGPKHLIKSFTNATHRAHGDIDEIIQKSNIPNKVELQKAVDDLLDGEKLYNTPLFASQSFFEEKGREYTFGFLWATSESAQSLSKFYLHLGAVAMNNASKAYQKLCKESKQ